MSGGPRHPLEAGYTSADLQPPDRMDGDAARIDAIRAFDNYLYTYIDR